MFGVRVKAMMLQLLLALMVSSAISKLTETFEPPGSALDIPEAGTSQQVPGLWQPPVQNKADSKIGGKWSLVLGDENYIADTGPLISDGTTSPISLYYKLAPQSSTFDDDVLAFKVMVSSDAGKAWTQVLAMGKADLVPQKAWNYAQTAVPAVTLKWAQGSAVTFQVRFELKATTYQPYWLYLDDITFPASLPGKSAAGTSPSPSAGGSPPGSPSVEPNGLEASPGSPPASPLDPPAGGTTSNNNAANPNQNVNVNMPGLNGSLGRHGASGHVPLWSLALAAFALWLAVLL